MKIIVEVNNRYILQIILFFVILTGDFMTLSAQDKNMSGKIDPVLRKIIARAQPASCLSTIDTNDRHKSNPQPFADSASIEKKYDCIVYTKNAKALRENGIVLNTVLPDFVTASATIRQILQMAEMPGVLKIEAPRIDREHH
ncbi:MAG: hypothetical protein WKF89_18760 [Chitinophagaceae bacterium]